MDNEESNDLIEELVRKEQERVLAEAKARAYQDADEERRRRREAAHILSQQHE